MRYHERENFPIKEFLSQIVTAASNDFKHLQQGTDKVISNNDSFQTILKLPSLTLRW
jgi:hypothetical protein